MARKPRSVSALEALATSELQAEIRRRQGKVGKLHRKHERLMAQLEAVRKEIAAAGGFAGSGKRASNSVNLVDALTSVLKNKTLGVSEAADAVLASGYVTTSSNFRTIVNQTFIKHRTKFKKVSRGKYTAA